MDFFLQFLVPVALFCGAQYLFMTMGAATGRRFTGGQWKRTIGRAIDIARDDFLSRYKKTGKFAYIQSAKKMVEMKTIMMSLSEEFPHPDHSEGFEYEMTPTDHEILQMHEKRLIEFDHARKCRKETISQASE